MKRLSGSCSLRNALKSHTLSINRRDLHSSIHLPASVAPALATGLPPPPAEPGVEHEKSRIKRRHEQAELLCRGQSVGRGGAGRRRFWQEVYVKEADGGLQIYLDQRPVRRSNSQILTLPATKPHLASAIALEWDLLVSSKQALKHHLIPLTSLASRALDIADADVSTQNPGSVRSGIVATLLRYLDTDSLLCWAPHPLPDPPGYEAHESRTEPLRVLQERAAAPILAFLETRVWPDVKIEPVLDGNSIMPKQQSLLTRKVIREWVHKLDPWDLAALERGVLAAKSLLIPVRLVMEWSENLAHLRHGLAQTFGVEEAARVASLEVEWQIGMWGAVEDTHDVEREDLRRQLGSVIILVNGNGEGISSSSK